MTRIGCVPPGNQRRHSRVERKEAFRFEHDAGDCWISICGTAVLRRIPCLILRAPTNRHSNG
ncbi:hypothetical protein I7I50_08099 [Histoplasma capsulatum G186AR]|uniref:Uncharacterized protein n=1 Tax=Ajellomyces capsulatus TaxID=5037 RepID=A0A8H7YH09_AJECA|nr:hypothetical protein I7I52_08615 [Histoplasma capsulatum]QSS68625.1 hypothetical protein I7I50_08099 [Histoplasma capsulatum G186AR]